MIVGAPVNVLDFGASPSASAATNTAAINAALASSTNVNLYFPPGIYNHTGISASNLDNLTITGDGATLFLANNSNVRALETTNCNYVHISGITLNGNQNNQTITGTRLNGSGIVINSALTVIIQNNTIKNMSTGASIVLNSADPFAADTTTESVLIDNNTIRNSGFVGAPFTCDAIYCQYDNARITNNKIFNSTDFGVALEYSKRSVVSNNLVYNAEVGLGGVGVDSCVFSDNTLTDCLFRGIFFSTGGQAVTSPWISYRTVVSNNVVNGVGGSLLPGNTHGIQVDYGNVHTDFVIIGNYIKGGNYGLTISTNGCIASNNQIKNSVSRGVLTDSNSYVNLFNNIVDTVTLPNYEIVKIGQVVDTDKTNNQIRFFTGTSSGAGVIYRACYIKTDNTTGNRTCVVNVTATSDVPSIGPSASFRQMSIKCVAGTLTITNMLPYSGDTTNIQILIAQNGTSRAEVLVGNSTTATTCSVIVDLISMDATQPFYIAEV
jgi:parallel beta-helix repeat protein